MSDKLIQAFSEIGVKNFDSYPMILRRVGLVKNIIISVP
ncbi:hypothetical protein LEP1GSC115_5077 [Leptospira interrogans serovar Australis str. 200703203]|nr:hypothetical protein LEP1GSC115_5077 [Leptospira interrogans serovar Australis str. 200703203]